MNRPDEFLKLLLKHQMEVKGFIGSVVPDRHLRDDVFQEVAVILWQQMDSYDPSRPFAAWARGIAANKILQMREKNARFPLPFSPETIEALRDEFDRTEPAGSEQLDALRECLHELPPHSRRLLELRYERNLACEQIAQETQRTLDAVYQTLSRLRTKLEECVRKRLAQTEKGTREWPSTHRLTS
jgi:RNA polymerase sigma-70 factor, ECF subfamily